MNENKTLEVTLAEAQQNLLALEAKKDKQEKKLEALRKEAREREQEQARSRTQPQPQVPPPTPLGLRIYNREEIASHTAAEKDRLLQEQELELRRYKEMERSLNEAQTILRVIQGQLPALQSTLANFEGMTLY
jgi:hypothetical protein